MRLKYASEPPNFSDPSEQAFMQKVIAGRADLGPLYRTLLISPPFASGFLRFFTALRYRSTLPLDVMELAMCRVAALNSAAVEWNEHAPLLKKGGVSDEGIETVRTAASGRKGSDGEGGLSTRMWDLMRYVDAVTKDIKVSDQVFEAMKKHLENDRQVFEFSKLTFSFFSCSNRGSKRCKLVYLEYIIE
jgi:alkylhydroperoxidase family enzyme